MSAVTRMGLALRRPAGLLAALAIAGSLAGAAGSKPDPSRLPAGVPFPIPVEARPILAFDISNPARSVFGRLRFVGGLELRSTFRGFGGLSGLVMRPDGSGLVAVSDAGYWLSADLERSGDRLSAVTGARMAPILDESGHALVQSAAGDVEAIASLKNGDVLISIEGRNRIRRYSLGQDGVGARGRDVADASGMARLRRNLGVEALAACLGRSSEADQVIAIAEATEKGTAQGWIWRPVGGKLRSFSVAVPDRFAVTDAACLESGEIILLERRYGALVDIAARLRLLSLEALERGEVGETLMEADLGYAIDNMEAVAVHRAADGKTMITIASDDNFSVLQRTLLLQFELR